MVFYTASEKHCASALGFMNDLRKDKSFCDVVLKVGNQSLSAHRCVLAAGSQYFKSLFLGQFTESTMGEINLSEVTTDVESMEIILNFIYLGQIDINFENLGVVIKLSSFFLLETLRDFCEDFMRKTLCLNNCLNYYIHAVAHGFFAMETSTSSMIKTRFHDCLIYEETSLMLSPEELMFLIDKGVLQHCSACSLLQFLMTWIIRGHTERHLEVGTELLEALERDECGGCKLSNEYNQIALRSLYESLVTELEHVSNEEKEIFMIKLQSSLEDLLTIEKTETLQRNVIVQTSPGSSVEITYPVYVPRNIFDSGSPEPAELAIITLSPKPCVIRDYLKQRENMKSLIHYETQPFGEPVYDVCAYIPRTNSWHYLFEFVEDETPEYLLDTNGYESRFYVMGNHLAIVDNRGDNIDMYNMNTGVWSAPSVGYTDANFDINHMANDVCFVTGQNDEKYLVVRMRIFTDQSFDQATEMYFKGYKLDESADAWNSIFVTSSRIRTNLSDNGGMPEMQARISKTSNEMIVTHSTIDGGWNVAFVANLNDISPTPVTLMSEFIEDKDLFRGLEILEENERFLLVANGTKNCGGTLQIMYEYMFNSKTLTEVRSDSMVISSITKPFEQDDEESEYPCLCEMSTTDGQSLWYLEGNLDSVSRLTQVSLQCDGRPVLKEHPPPPFACVTKMFAGPVYTRLLRNTRHITKFLLKEKRMASPKS